MPLNKSMIDVYENLRSVIADLHDHRCPNYVMDDIYRTLVKLSERLQTVAYAIGIDGTMFNVITNDAWNNGTEEEPEWEVNDGRSTGYVFRVNNEPINQLLNNWDIPHPPDAIISFHGSGYDVELSNGQPLYTLIELDRDFFLEVMRRVFNIDFNLRYSEQEVIDAFRLLIDEIKKTTHDMSGHDSFGFSIILRRLADLARIALSSLRVENIYAPREFDNEIEYDIDNTNELLASAFNFENINGLEATINGSSGETPAIAADIVYLFNQFI
jgi:hypothetical protein